MTFLNTESLCHQSYVLASSSEQANERGTVSGSSVKRNEIEFS